MTTPCKHPGCTGQAMWGDYCVPHDIQQRFARRAQRQAKRGDVLGSLMAGAGAVIAGQMPEALQDPERLARRARRTVDAVGRRPPPKPKTADPFEFLGLDRDKATVDDVKRVQRHLAALYHGDKASSAVDQKRMALINAAATAAIEHIEQRK